MLEPIRMSIALTQHEIDIVQEHSSFNGINNFSAALRMIIREWARLVKDEPISEQSIDQ